MILEKVDENKSLQFLSVNAFTYKIFFLGQKLRFWQGGGRIVFSSRFRCNFRARVFRVNDQNGSKGNFPHSGRKNWGISPHFRRRRRREKFLSKKIESQKALFYQTRSIHKCPNYFPTPCSLSVFSARGLVRISRFRSEGGGQDSKIFGREGPENGVEGVVLENFSDF